MLKRIYYFLSSGTFLSRTICTLLFLGGIVLISLPLANRMTVDQVANIPKYLPAGSDASAGAKKPDNTKLRFEANSGQNPRDVKYLAKTAIFSLSFSQNEVVFRKAKSGELRMRFTGGAASTQIRAEDLLDVAKGIPNYGRIVYGGVYKDIDAVFYGDRNSLEYELVVGPGGDPKVISIAFKGSTQTVIENDGTLTLRVGADRIKFGAPSAFQEIGGERRPVKARYIKQTPTGNIGFEIGEYDPGKPLVIGQKLTF